MTLTERLRDYINNIDDCLLRKEAADEIDRLSAENAALREERDALNRCQCDYTIEKHADGQIETYCGCKAMLGERNELMQERDALAATALEANRNITMLREEIKKFSSLHASTAYLCEKAQSERDALASCVDFLRKGMDGMGKHNASVKWHLERSQDPAAILAARDARMKAGAKVEALQDAALDRLLAVGVVVYSNDIKKGEK